MLNELMVRNARRPDEPDTKNRAIAMRELALAGVRASMHRWLFARHTV